VNGNAVMFIKHPAVVGQVTPLDDGLVDNGVLI
jgi:hypothetical protein